MFLLPVFMVAFSITMCYYHVNIMYVYADWIMDTFYPLLVGWPSIQRVVYWKLVFIGKLTQLASTLYSALSCIIMIKIYICASALNKDLLEICTKQHVSQFKLQIWRRKYRFLKKHKEICEWLFGRKRARPSHPKCIHLELGYLPDRWYGAYTARPCTSFLYHGSRYGMSHSTLCRSQWKDQ